MTEQWLITDERIDAISSLKLYIDTINKVETDMIYWKWVIISLHNTVQSIISFHLGFGNDLLVMSQVDAEAWLQAHDSGTEHPETKMDNFLNLYKKIKSHQILGYKFTPSGQEGKSIKRLNNYRNEFIHFIPKGWSIEMSGMPDICKDCLNIIKKLIDGPINQRWENDEQANQFSDLLTSAINKTNEIFH